jgi:hypothetical protein
MRSVSDQQPECRALIELEVHSDSATVSTFKIRAMHHSESDCNPRIIGVKCNNMCSQNAGFVCTCESLTSTKALANQSARAQKLRHIRSCWSASPVRIVTSRATMASSHRAFAVTDQTLWSKPYISALSTQAVQPLPAAESAAR